MIQPSAHAIFYEPPVIVTGPDTRIARPDPEYPYYPMGCGVWVAEYRHGYAPYYGRHDYNDPRTRIRRYL